MKLLKNEGVTDRLVRVLLGEVLFIVGFFWLSGFWQIVSYVLVAIMLLTAATGFCALYLLCKINTNNNKLISKTLVTILSILFIFIATLGSYYSIFFTKKFFLEDYNKMNNYYKQTLFYTGQGQRTASVDNYNKLAAEYFVFNTKYQTYHPYVFMGDIQFNNDLAKVSDIIISLKDKVNTGDLKSSHTDFEQIRPIFQDILKRNGFSILAVALVDFHDAMEKIIAAADAKDAPALVAVYPEVNDKLKAVEESATDSEIQVIRQKLDEVFNLAKDGKLANLSAKAAELKSAFVKVYLKRG